jgi:V/A-type H+-transporting ATPase subunit I
MKLRPLQARWFETYVPRDQTVHATEVLARTGQVHLETDTRVLERVDEGKLRHFVDRFRNLAATHEHDLHGVGRQATVLEGDPVHLANLALHRLRVWSARVDFVKAHVDHLHAEQQFLQLLAECLEAMDRLGLDLDGMFRKTRFLCKCLFACPKGFVCDPEIESSVEKVVPGEAHDFIYIAGLHEKRHLIRQFVVEHGCQQLGIPAWLTGSMTQQKQALGQHLHETRADIMEMQTELKALRTDTGMAQAKANMDTLEWYLEHAAGTLNASEYCHVTGWTTAVDVRELQQALEAEGIHAIIRLPAPPAHAEAPVAPLDDWWAQPFQSITAMWGTPGRNEVNPTGLLALVVPLLFGYMFPDVGHGLMLIVFAAFFWRRWPRIRFLLPCGVAAMLFGVLFGDVFGFHNLLQPLWMRPMDDPLAVLAVPMLFGIGLMLLGLLFAGIEARWRGEMRRWVLTDLAVLLIYASALAGLLWSQVFWFTGLAAVYYLMGSALLAPVGARLASLPGAVGDLLLSGFELSINTLSFLRVGAFALAHAALSHAVLSLAGAVDAVLVQGLIILVGNLFAVVMEGLLVFVQSTRLVLFEFFTRFLRADGRLFRPLHGPNPANRRAVQSRY